MLQRVQTIFLLVVVISMALIFVAPIWQRVDTETGAMARVTAVSVTLADAEGNTTDTLPAIWIMVVAGLSVGIGITSITRYSNRMMQIRLNFLNTLFILGTLGLMIMYVLRAEGMVSGEAGNPFLWGFFLPVPALFANSIANRFIYRDEKMVRDADRIR